MIKKLLLTFTAITIISSCVSTKEEEKNIAWIGGEIVNPVEDYVYFYQGEQIIDSVALNENNKFILKMEDLEPGLYSFTHKEFQVFYLEPNDSLMLRVNTIDFDESLSYTGIGADKNNFLIEMFLINEAEIELMPKFYKLPPLEFENAIDSLKEIRTSIYEDYVLKHEPHDEFKMIAEASINYDYYSKKEIYITANLSKKKYDSYQEIPDSFYNYRKNIDFGNETLRSYFPYYRFLFRYFDNMALESNNENDFYNKNVFKHNYNKIKIIDSTVTNAPLKNSLFKNIAGRFILSCNSKDNHEKMLALFNEVNTNEEYQLEISELADASMKLTPGNKIPNLSLITPENTSKSLLGVINNPTVFYLWSSESKSYYKNIHKKAKELNTKFPEYDFIGLNVDLQYQPWINLVEKSGYKKGKEYLFEDLEKAKKSLVSYSLNKAIVVDENGVILNGSANLFNKKIEESLLAYLNK